jgi:hypothetical protein
MNTFIKCLIFLPRRDTICFGSGGEEGEKAPASAEEGGEQEEKKDPDVLAAQVSGAEKMEEAKGKGEAGCEVDADHVPSALNRLDLLLTYLWRVHGIDYYAGYELTAAEFSQRLTGTR